VSRAQLGGRPEPQQHAQRPPATVLDTDNASPRTADYGLTPNSTGGVAKKRKQAFSDQSSQRR